MVNQLRRYALIIACTLTAQLGANPTYNPQNTTIFFDLHDVVLKKDSKRRIKLTITNPIRTIRFARNMVSKDGLNNGEEYALKLKERGSKKQAALVRKFSTAYKVNADVVEIINALKAKGYTVSMASNIGRQNLDDLLNPHLFDNGQKLEKRIKVRTAIESFDELVFVDYEGQDFVSKPNPEYFAVLRNNCGSDTHALFVDDKKENVKAAENCGLHGIRFKSAKQLKKEFQALGIL